MYKLRWWQQLCPLLCIFCILFKIASQWLPAFKLEWKYFTGSFTLTSDRDWWKDVLIQSGLLHLFLLFRSLKKLFPPLMFYFQSLYFSAIFLFCAIAVVLNANEVITGLAVQRHFGGHFSGMLTTTSFFFWVLHWCWTSWTNIQAKLKEGRRKETLNSNCQLVYLCTAPLTSLNLCRFIPAWELMWSYVLNQRNRSSVLLGSSASVSWIH